jgi:hypothetical protein
MGRSIFVLGYQHCCRGQTKRSMETSKRTYAKGFSTARQGCLQVTGSYCRYGVSGFSFKGV